MKQHSTELKIEINYFDDDDLPESDRYVASILNQEYRGNTVASNSISGCLKELSISLKVLEEYKIKKQNEA